MAEPLNISSVSRRIYMIGSLPSIFYLALGIILLCPMVGGISSGNLTMDISSIQNAILNGSEGNLITLTNNLELIGPSIQEIPGITLNLSGYEILIRQGSTLILNGTQILGRGEIVAEDNSKIYLQSVLWIQMNRNICGDNKVGSIKLEDNASLYAEDSDIWCASIEAKENSPIRLTNTISSMGHVDTYETITISGGRVSGKLIKAKNLSIIGCSIWGRKESYYAREELTIICEKVDIHNSKASLGRHYRYVDFSSFTIKAGSLNINKTEITSTGLLGQNINLQAQGTVRLHNSNIESEGSSRITGSKIEIDNCTLQFTKYGSLGLQGNTLDIKRTNFIFSNQGLMKVNGKTIILENCRIEKRWQQQTMILALFSSIPVVKNTTLPIGPTIEAFDFPIIILAIEPDKLLESANLKTQNEVFIDLSELPGYKGTTQLLDNGINGDPTPSDGSFSTKLRIPAGSQGTHLLPTWVAAKWIGEPTFALFHTKLNISEQNLPLCIALVFGICQILTLSKNHAEATAAQNVRSNMLRR